MRELVMISVCPDDLCFVWQVKVMLNNFRKYGYSEKEHILVLRSTERKNNQTFNKEWEELVSLFPETTFHFYDANEEILGLIRSFNYSPIARPYLLKKHWEKFPEWKDKAVFYHDSDIVFTKPLDFTPYLSDNIAYLSNTKGYTGVEYFDSKVKDVDPKRLKEYKKIDVLDNYMKIFGLFRKDAEDNDEGSGGAQYILKDIDAGFWQSVLEGALYIRTYLALGVNQRFMRGDNPAEKEINGFQSWCADMFSILPCLWKRGLKTTCPKELDFTWREHEIKRWGENAIYHDAGAATVTKEGVEYQLFRKEKNEYRANELTPFEDDLSFVSDKFCSYNYVKEIEAAKELH